MSTRCRKVRRRLLQCAESNHNLHHGEREIAKADTLLAEYGIKYSQVSTLAEKMAEKNSNISVEYIDLDQNPAFASEYKDDGDDCGCAGENG